MANSTHENLIKKVLDELLLERPRSQEAVEVGTQELGYEVAAEVSTMTQVGCGSIFQRRTCPRGAK